MHIKDLLAGSMLMTLTLNWNPAHASSPPASAFVGEWSGVRQLEASHYRGREAVKYTIRATEHGLEIVDDTRAAIGMDAAQAMVNGQVIRASLPAMLGHLELVGELSTDGRRLRISIVGETDSRHDAAPVILTHTNPETSAYFQPGKRGGSSDIGAPPVRMDDGWDVGQLGRTGANVALFNDMVRAIERQTSDPNGNQTDSVLVAVDGKLVFERYFWGYDRANPHEISSDTKSVTSILTGVAVDRGKVEPSEFLWPAFQDYASSKWVKGRYPISLEETLSMTANLDWNEDLPYQDPRNTAVGLAVAPDPVAYVLDRGLAGIPGAKFQYNSGLPNLVGDLVSRRVGMPFGEFAAQNLFAPLGIQNWYWTTQKNGHVLAAGGLYLLPRDMAKIGQMMLDGGVWQGRQIVSPHWVQISTTQHTPERDYAYGYFWHLSTSQKPRLDGETGYMAIGQGGQYIVVIPRLHAVIVLTSSNWQPGGTKLGLSEIIDRYIVPALQGRNGPH